MPRLSVVVLSVVLGATLALPAAAQWKWRDKGGQIQYSDLPPPQGVADQDILQRPLAAQRRAAAAPPAASAASAAARVEPELEARRRKDEQEQAAKKQEQAAKKKADDEKVAAGRADNCTRAKGYMRTLDDGLRIARVNDKGEREILDDKARAEEIKRTREVMASDCK
jgi:type IV secretory pathway VirB10-like protein